jgi:hypothetical protein
MLGCLVEGLGSGTWCRGLGFGTCRLARLDGHISPLHTPPRHHTPRHTTNKIWHSCMGAICSQTYSATPPPDPFSPTQPSLVTNLIYTNGPTAKEQCLDSRSSAESSPSTASPAAAETLRREGSLQSNSGEEQPLNKSGADVGEVIPTFAHAIRGCTTKAASRYTTRERPHTAHSPTPPTLTPSPTSSQHHPRPHPQHCISGKPLQNKSGKPLHCKSSTPLILRTYNVYYGATPPAVRRSLARLMRAEKCS